MPRAEFGTPKWLSNRMKSKGLQRLRWYCQMCNKQCRDENGFKCHRMSEGHRRQMQIFSQRPGKYISEFSRQFEATFMRLIRTRYSRARVLANTVYCDLISDKQHVHMNATTWTSLSEFIWYLKRSGKVEVEYSDEGWYIQYVDHGRMEFDERVEAKRREELSAEQCRSRIMNELIKQAWDNAEQPEEKVIKSLDKEKLTETQIKLKKKEPSPEVTKPKKRQVTATFTESDHDEPQALEETNSSRKMSALELLYYEQERKKQYKLKRNPDKVIPQRKLSPSLDRFIESSDSEYDDPENENVEEEEVPWVQPNLIVKINCEEEGFVMYNGKKGRILNVKEEFLAETEILKTKDIVLLDQTMLEQILPVRNGLVKVISGTCKGEVGKVMLVDLENEIMQVKLNDERLLEFPFSVLCKYMPDTA